MTQRPTKLGRIYPKGLLQSVVHPVTELARLQNIGGDDRDSWFYRRTAVPTSFIEHRKWFKQVGKLVMSRTRNADHVLSTMKVDELSAYPDEMTLKEVRNEIARNLETRPSSSQWSRATPEEVAAFEKAEARLTKWCQRQESKFMNEELRRRNTVLRDAYNLLADSGRMVQESDGALLPLIEAPPVTTYKMGSLGFGILRMQEGGNLPSYVTGLRITLHHIEINLMRRSLRNAMTWPTREAAQADLNKHIEQIAHGVRGEYSVVDLDTAVQVSGTSRPYLMKYPFHPKETKTGWGTIKTVFNTPKNGVVAGVMIDRGSVHVDGQFRLRRHDSLVWSGNIESIKRLRDSVKEVKAGFECGIKLKDCNDIRVGDVLEFYK
jgi:hypothetical protein